MYNLVEYNGKRKVRTVKWNSPYVLCKGLKNITEAYPVQYGTYFKIERNEA